MESPLKRISLLIREDQYNGLVEKGVNVSGLMRDLVDDYLSQHKITLSVSEDTYKLYGEIILNMGGSDAELEPHLRTALRGLLKKKIQAMQALERKAFR